jgi:hypothetical protein
MLSLHMYLVTTSTAVSVTSTSFNESFMFTKHLPVASWEVSSSSPCIYSIPLFILLFPSGVHDFRSCGFTVGLRGSDELCLIV